MSDIIESLNLWPTQDALLAALGEQAALADVATDLGFPTNIEPSHVWIDGGATGALTQELSGAGPSEETFRLTVFVFAQADDYPTVRDRVKALASAVGVALDSATFAAVVPAWTIPDYRLDAGTDGTHRQLALELVVQCTCW